MKQLFALASNAPDQETKEKADQLLKRSSVQGLKNILEEDLKRSLSKLRSLEIENEEASAHYERQLEHYNELSSGSFIDRAKAALMGTPKLRVQNIQPRTTMVLYDYNFLCELLGQPLVDSIDQIDLHRVEIPENEELDNQIAQFLSQTDRKAQIARLENTIEALRRKKEISE